MSNNRPKTSRRNFLKTSAVFAGAIAAPILYSSEAHAENQKHEAIKATIRKAVITRINFHRRKHKLQVVKIDKLATKAGDLHCQDLMRAGRHGHYSSDGRVAYHRYSNLGGSHKVSENASKARWSGIVMDQRMLIDKALQMHDEMYSEKPPHDGHRINILSPKHNHVGIGIEFDAEKGLCMMQEFTDHYLEIVAIKRTAKPGETIELEGRLLEWGTIQAIDVYFEPFPKPIAPNSKTPNQYSFPSSRKTLSPKLPKNYTYTNGSKGVVELTKYKQNFKSPIRFDQGPGIYTIAVWVEHPRFGTFQATNICIEVK